MALLLFFFLFFFKFLSSLFFICSLAATSIIGNEECPSTVWVAASPGAYRRLDRGQTTINATRFNIYNKCTYTVWAAAVPGGGRSLDSGQTWAYDVNDTEPGRIWPRTGCNFDGAGRGQCQTGDCGGVLQCQGYGTGQPNTLAEYSLNQSGIDFFDISLVDGFNVPMEFSPTSGGCSRGITCTGDINGQCPNQLKAPGGCNNPCTVFKTDQYCCTSANCGPTNFSRFFKAQCPDAYSYPLDNANSTFTCPAGTNYRVVFCP